MLENGGTLLKVLRPFPFCFLGKFCFLILISPQMEGTYGMQLVVVLCLGLLMRFTWCQNNANAVSAVYIVTLKQAPASHYNDELRVKGNQFKHGKSNRLDKPRY